MRKETVFTVLYNKHREVISVIDSIAARIVAAKKSKDGITVYAKGFVGYDDEYYWTLLKTAQDLIDDKSKPDMLYRLETNDFEVVA